MKPINSKFIAATLAAGLLLLILWPVRLNWVKKPKDNFPLSHYPMFSHLRGGQATITYLLGVEQSQRRVYLSYEMAGTGGMNQVRKVIRKQAERNPEKFCQQVAKRVAQAAAYRAVEKVKILKSEFVFDKFFNGESTPQKSEVLCTCEVNRASE